MTKRLKPKNPALSKEQQKIRDLFDKHVPLMRDFLNLTEWEISTHIAVGVFPHAKKSAMTCDTSLKYLEATITAYDPAYTCDDEDEIIKLIMHELCHIITEPLYIAACDNAAPTEASYLSTLREQATERTARIALKGYLKRGV